MWDLTYCIFMNLMSISLGKVMKNVFRDSDAGGNHHFEFFVYFERVFGGGKACRGGMGTVLKPFFFTFGAGRSTKLTRKLSETR